MCTIADMYQLQNDSTPRKINFHTLFSVFFFFQVLEISRKVYKKSKSKIMYVRMWIM